jgi:hypothetical protein
MKGKEMLNPDVTSLAPEGSIDNRSFLKRIWQSILRFDEALNFDPHNDLARRISDLERKSRL